MAAPLQPCVFFDRDGIANVDPPPHEYYVLGVDRLFIIPEFIESLRVVASRGYAAVIVTNQKCVAKGMLTPEGLDAIHAHLRRAVANAGTALLDIYACPFGDGHPDRKPQPGMLLRAAHDHGLDLARSWMIGDMERDMLAGRAAGCATTVLVSARVTSPAADHRVNAMRELPGFLHEHLPPAMAKNPFA